MSLAAMYQAAEEQAFASRSEIKYHAAKDAMVLYGVDRALMRESLEETAPGKSLSPDGLVKYARSLEDRRRLGGDTPLSRTLTGGSTGHEKAYAEAWAAYQEKHEDFSLYMDSGLMGSDPSDSRYQLYQDMSERMDELAGACGHMGAKDHGLMPQMSSKDRWQDACDGVTDYLSDQRDSFGRSEAFKVDCRSEQLSERQVGILAGELGMEPDAVEKKAADAKTLFGRQLDDSLPGPVSDRFVRESVDAGLEMP